MSELLRDEPDQPSRYETICMFYIGQIANGSIRPGELLPTAYRVAEQHGTSASTARPGLPVHGAAPGKNLTPLNTSGRP